MITGHFGIALAFRTADRGPWKPLWLPALLAAAILPDVVDLAYAVARFCSPLGLYSHSLPALGALAAIAFVAGFVLARNVRFALLMAAVVLLHLPADFVTGEKILWPGGPVVGLVIYRWPIADFLIELPIVLCGWALLRRTPGARRAHPWATSWQALALLIALQGAMDFAKILGEKVKPTGCVAGTVVSSGAVAGVP